MISRKSLLLAATAACTFASIGHAQTAPAVAVAVAEDDASGVEDIIVTARKKEERLIDVPLTIAVVGAATIDRAHLLNISDIANQTPGFSFKQGFGRTGGGGGAGVRPSIRGMSSVVGAPNAAFFVDGIFVSDNIASYQLDNLERVEVIKGPQSALFGRGTFAGAISFVTRKPTNEFTGRVKISYAEYDNVEASGYISGPIIKDKLLFELNARSYSFGGDYVNAATGVRDIGDQKSVNFSGRLLFKPSDSFEAIASFGFSKDRDKAYGYQPQGSLNNNCFAPVITTTVPFPRTDSGRRGFYCGEVKVLPSYFANNNALEALGYHGLDRKFYRSSLAMTYSTDGGTTLTSTTAYNHNYSITGQDNGTVVTAAPSFGIDGSQNNDFSQEFRLSTPQEKRIRGSIGGYWYQEDVGTGFQVDQPTNTRRRFDSPNGVRSKSIFGQIEASVTDQLTVSAEARQQYDHITGSTRVLGAAGAPPASAIGIRTADYNALLPRFTARYKINEDLNVYATGAKGNKPGGFNTFPTNATPTELTRLMSLGFNTFDEETAWSYELGSKGRYKGVNFAVAAFYTDWKQQQLSRGEPYQTTAVAPTFTSVSLIRNAGESEIKGFEIELSGNPTEWLSLRAAYTFVDAKFTTFFDDTTEEIFDTDGKSAFLPNGQRNPADVDGPDGGDVSGNRLPQTPQHQAIFTAQVTKPIMGELEFFSSADLAYESKRYSQVDNLNYAGDSFNLNASVGIKKANWSFTVYARNLLDDKTPLVVTRILDFNRLLSRVNPATGTRQTTFFRDFFVSAPRKQQFGATASYKF